MEQLVRVQLRKVGGTNEGAIEEIKRIELEIAWVTKRAYINQCEQQA